MGYREVVTPAIGHWQFRPSRAQLAAALEHLQASGWVRPEARVSDNLVYLHPSKVASAMATTARDRCLTLYLEGGPGGKDYPEDWPDDQLELTPDLCEDVLVVDSPEGLVLPTGEAELSLPCPSCGEDLVGTLPLDMPETEADVEPDAYLVLADGGIHRAPRECPACGEGLQHSEMALMSEDETIEETPFFHFGLVFLSVLTRPEPLVSIDPALLEALQRICGVPFRSTAIDD